MKALRRLAALLLLGLWASAAYGDGGTVLLHQDAGPFSVTLFAASQPLRVGAADLSVMVQDKTTGQVLLDPVIDLTISPQSANARAQTVRLARGLASNRLLQAATVDFPHSGRWRLTVLVARGSETAHVSMECTVEPNHSRAELVWFYVLLPVGIIVLFVLHQVLKLRSEGKVQ
ncbi:MAG TPA: hypothetical protein VMB49_18360 [Acidobacteriaceae bacterium]|nr:hypothetical protein [Acidobacteriaceae bacterium]